MGKWDCWGGAGGQHRPVPSGLTALGRNALENPPVFQRVGLLLLQIYRRLRPGGTAGSLLAGDTRVPKDKGLVFQECPVALGTQLCWPGSISSLWELGEASPGPSELAGGI